ncbi:hypothetical protein MUK42_35700 [Musa troglodytarum]|uniref:Uncharacterized protein n=1 Tax=Musa troglodytarum TaxID=320322 RepID=A0A9E7JD61_9LILI|nr:hypothetical protein MUK42_35700 [Musa troglodytarum]URD76786.1 hypothetical protein MUK42_35700 [Musa troglodytarum]URD76787.1 hypothetical protein MUK42_35700 [Musa troglodytarum]
MNWEWKQSERKRHHDRPIGRLWTVGSKDERDRLAVGPRSDIGYWICISYRVLDLHLLNTFSSGADGARGRHEGARTEMKGPELAAIPSPVFQEVVVVPSLWSSIRRPSPPPPPDTVASSSSDGRQGSP